MAMFLARQFLGAATASWFCLFALHLNTKSVAKEMHVGWSAWKSRVDDRQIFGLQITPYLCCCFFFLSATAEY
jgi:hypothetical protein